MKQQFLFVFCYLFVSISSNSSSRTFAFVTLSPKKKSATTNAVIFSERGGGEGERKDYGGDAASLFGNFRIPASLFAGASIGAAFAMPIGAAEDGLRIGIIKRSYALLMIGSLSSQLITIIVSTAAMVTISSCGKSRPKTSSVGELLNQHFELEWTAARLFFNAGLMMFAAGAGLRSLLSIGCPVFANAAFGFILSSTILCIAFMREMERALVVGDDNGVDGNYSTSNLFTIFVRFVSLLTKHARKQPLFALSAFIASITGGYLILKTPHIVYYLTSHK